MVLQLLLSEAWMEAIRRVNRVEVRLVALWLEGLVLRSPSILRQWRLLLLHHVGRILEHLVGQVEGAFLVDVIGGGSLADIDIPQAKHLIPLYLDLSLAITSRYCRTIRRHASV